MFNRDTFAPLLLSWWDAGHRALPWRDSRDPYHIWVAEVMLQQTQIKTVIPYYHRWFSRFPDMKTLAEASLDEVLRQWEGLGYYSRARHMHAAAKTIVAEFDGVLPCTAAELMKLKGIGRYTAGAIASIACDEPVPVLDGNVIRILSRLIDLSMDVTKSAAKTELWRMAGDLVPLDRPGEYNQALMELGQLVCVPAAPRCHLCPVSAHCLARRNGTALERPVRPPRKNIPHFDVVAAVIWDGTESVEESTMDRFLVAQRPLDGLLGGLWEFPGGKREAGESLPEALRREIQEEIGIEVNVGEQLATIKHAYTHFRITLHAFHVYHHNGRPQNLGVMNHAWVSLADLHKYAFAVTDRKIIAALKEEMGQHV